MRLIFPALAYLQSLDLLSLEDWKIPTKVKGIVILIAFIFSFIFIGLWFLTCLFVAASLLFIFSRKTCIILQRFVVFWNSEESTDPHEFLHLALAALVMGAVLGFRFSYPYSSELVPELFDWAVLLAGFCNNPYHIFLLLVRREQELTKAKSKDDSDE